MEEVGESSKCMGALLLGDCKSCAATAQQALNAYQKPISFTLLVLGRQRMGKKTEAEQAGNRALAALSYVPWHNIFFGILLGGAKMSEYLPHAPGDEERCQLCLYEGAGCATEGQVAEAQHALTQSFACPSEVVERVLVKTERASSIHDGGGGAERGGRSAQTSHNACSVCSICRAISAASTTGVPGRGRLPGQNSRTWLW